MAILPAAKYSQLTQDQATTLVNAMSGAGGNGFFFTVPAAHDGQARTVAYTVTGTFTVATATLKSSTDGGTTFQSYGAGAAQYAAVDCAANKNFEMTGLVPGLCYTLTISAVTGTSITISAAVA